jgi:hypothetical protein
MGPFFALFEREVRSGEDRLQENVFASPFRVAFYFLFLLSSEASI